MIIKLFAVTYIKEEADDLINAIKNAAYLQNYKVFELHFEKEGV